MAEWPDEVRLDKVFCKGETEKAILVVVGPDELWVPKSQVSDNSEVYKRGDEGDLVVSG